METTFDKFFYYLQTNLNISNSQFTSHVIDLFESQNFLKLQKLFESNHYERLREIFQNESNSTTPIKKLMFKDLPAFQSYQLNFHKEILSIYDFLPQIRMGSKIDIDTVVEVLKNRQVCLITGNTGCGKSTHIPTLLLNHFNKILVTQPRKMAAISIAKKVALDLNVNIGEYVGYSVRFDNCSTNKTRLKYCTDGILLSELARNRSLKNYDLFIIDESHERTLNIDLLLCYFKHIMKSNPNVRLLIMSATIDAERFKSYFQTTSINICVERFKIDRFYLKTKCLNYIEKALETILRIEKEYSEGDILVFLTGNEDINMCHKFLIQYSCQADIIPLYSMLPTKSQNLIFKKGKRKIILSTNIAETSITITTVKFVIDCGYVKQVRCINGGSLEYLDTVRISKAQTKQREGRVGRTQDGYVYKLYTHNEYLSMLDYTIPEILRSNLSEMVLKLKNLKIKNIFDLEFLDNPDHKSLTVSLSFLYHLRAIDIYGNVTKHGILINKVPLPPDLATSLLVSKRLGVEENVATIAAFLSVERVFNEVKPDDPLYSRLITIKKKFLNPKGDFYMYLEIYRAWKKSKFSKKFLFENMLDVKGMYDLQRIRTQLLILCSKYVKTGTTDQISNGIEESFCAGYFMNTAKKSEKKYLTIFGEIECQIHHKDLLFKKQPKIILFVDFLCVKSKALYKCLEITKDVLIKATNTAYIK